MSLEATNGRRLRDAPFPFQQTYITPLKDLPRFVRSLLQPFSFESAVFHLETIVFNPEELIAYLSAFEIQTDEGELSRAILYAESASEAESLLEKVLGEWIDFAFIPCPLTFVVYADHDEYATVFTSSAELLASLRKAMTMQQFKAVEDWQWMGPHSASKTGKETNV